MRIATERYLPTELVREILGRLPSKTLLRLRSVCKTWCSLISSSDFIFFHLNCYNNNNNSESVTHHIVYEKKFKIPPCSSSEIPNVIKLPKSYLITGSCNGLILLYTRDDDEIILWNPSVRRSLFVPYFPISPFTRTRVHVLGYSPASNDYKVVRLENTSSSEVSVAVYSLNDNLWRPKPSPVSKWGVGIFDFQFPIVCCGGAVCWVGRSNLKWKLNLYDFDSEVFSDMQMPDDAMNDDSVVWFVFAHGESIAVFTMSSQRTCIWVLDKHKEVPGDYRFREIRI